MPLLRVYDPSPHDFAGVEAFRLVLADGRTVICEADPRVEGRFRLLAYGVDGEPTQRHERPPLLHAVIEITPQRGEISYLRLESRGGNSPAPPPAPPVRIEFEHEGQPVRMPYGVAALFLPDGRHIQVEITDERGWPGESGSVGVRAWPHDERDDEGGLGLPVVDLYFHLSAQRVDISSTATRSRND